MALHLHDLTSGLRGDTTLTLAEALREIEPLRPGLGSGTLTLRDLQLQRPGMATAAPGSSRFDRYDRYAENAANTTWHSLSTPVPARSMRGQGGEAQASVAALGSGERRGGDDDELLVREILNLKIEGTKNNTDSGKRRGAVPEPRGMGGGYSCGGLLRVSANNRVALKSHDTMGRLEGLICGFVLITNRISSTCTASARPF